MAPSAPIPTTDHETMGTAMSGNLPVAQNIENARYFLHFMGTQETSFGAGIARGAGLKLVRADVFLPEGSQDNQVKEVKNEGAKVPVKGISTKTSESAEARTECEVTVTKEMCNIYGTLHGGCAAYLIDLCSSTAIVCYGIYTGTDGTGVSTSMDISWHRPIFQGRSLKIVSNTVFVDGLVRSARCEFRDAKTNKLYVSAVHATIAGGKRTEAFRKGIEGKEGEGKAKL